MRIVSPYFVFTKPKIEVSVSICPSARPSVYLSIYLYIVLVPSAGILSVPIVVIFLVPAQCCNNIFSA